MIIFKTHFHDFCYDYKTEYLLISKTGYSIRSYKKHTNNSFYRFYNYETKNLILQYKLYENL